MEYKVISQVSNAVQETSDLLKQSGSLSKEGGLASNVLAHANVHLPWGPLKYVFVTQDFHHWHHSSDDVAIDRNYAAHYAFLDHLFGTAIKGQKGFPEKYGVQGDYMPDGFVKQQKFPFTSQK